MNAKRNAARSFFQQMPHKQRIEWKSKYEDLLANESGTLQLKNANGKLVVRQKFPWMVEAWKLGLEIITEVIKEEEVKTEVEQ